MSLVTADDCRVYCRQQTNAEAATFALLRATAIGSIENYIGRPIVAESRQFVDEAQSKGGPVRALMVPITPLASVESVTDRDNAEVDLEQFRIDQETGLLVLAFSAASLRSGPYTITATVGLSARSDYERTVEPVINGAILDIVADRFQRRNPNASQESEGGGVSVSYASHGLPQRVCDDLKAIGVLGVA